MSRASQRKLVAALLIALALWPAVHRVLVPRLGFDAWELFGFAMYALPQARVQVAIDGRLADRAEPVHVRMGDERLRAFVRRRTLLGGLASPSSLARALFEEEPRLAEVTVRMRSIRLDLDTAHLVAHDTTETLQRADTLRP